MTGSARAIQLASCRDKAGLLRRFAPRNDAEGVSIWLQTVDTRSRSRGTTCPRFAFRCPSKTEGAGNAGCALHPRSRVQKVREKHAHEHTGQRRTSDIPCAMALRLIRAHPGDLALLSPSPRGTWHVSPVGLSAPPHDMTPTLRLSGPHDFAVRFGAVRPARRCPLTENRPANTLRARHRRVHRIPSQRSVTMANAPPPGQDGESRKGDLPDGLSGILPDGLICRSHGCHAPSHASSGPGCRIRKSLDQRWRGQALNRGMPCLIDLRRRNPPWR